MASSLASHPQIDSLIKEVLADATAFRHDLHQHPELGYQEHRTSEKVQGWLSSRGIAMKGGLARGTGVLGYLPATKNADSARTVMLRADMDALPIHEETDVPYRSTHPGKMHACGHDGHTSILAATAHVLNKLDDRPQNVVFLFQPAEEGGAGAKRMIADGALNGTALGKPVDTAYGLHCFPNVKLGSMTTRVGPLMAAASQFDIDIRGKGSHAAYPHWGIDPIVVAAHIITALQSVASRTVGPLDSVVVTVGQVKAGMAHNIIPDTARLTGTLRTLDGAVEAVAKEAILRIVENTALAFGATATVSWWEDGYPVTFNHPDATQRVRTVLAETFGADKIGEEAHPSMGGEDFSFYGHVVPACFFFMGILPEGQDSYPNLHAPGFNFNDDAIPYGVEAMVNLALRG